MAIDVEVLRTKTMPVSGDSALRALTGAIRRSGASCVETSSYRGNSEWLVLFGVGAKAHTDARDRQVSNGGKALLLDMGYFGRHKLNGYTKTCINTDHPQSLLDRAPDDARRWERLQVTLREDHDPSGHIVLAGLGRKQRAYLGIQDWEARALKSIRDRFPGKRVVYRPKRESDPTLLPCDRDGTSRIEDVLKGASLVVCRQSNVAVDAVVAGVPFEAVDGAAMWLKGREYSAENRLAFLQKLAWFQWLPHEMGLAWKFLRGIA